MVTNNIDFEAIEQKTSAEFVKRIKNTVENVSTWTEKEIQFHIEEDEYTFTVVMCYYGSVSRREYRFSTGQINVDSVYWTDIRKFFDIPLEMKNIRSCF